MLPSLDAIRRAAAAVHEVVAPTPQLHWPLLSERCGCEVWVKHENHLPTGAFKVRGGIWFAKNVLDDPDINGVIAATRGNHGQSIALAAQRHHKPAVIVVPVGNNPEKNAAMRALGAELVEWGADFDEALNRAEQLAESRGLKMVPSFDPLLVEGVASYALELFEGAPALERVYVPIGLGSGICGVVAVRNALALDTQIIGVVAANANAYQLSFEAGRVVSTDSADTFADGLAVRVPDPRALEVLIANVERVVAVSEAEIERAMAALLRDTHNLSEGAGASALAALLQDQSDPALRLEPAQTAAIILSGANASKRDLQRTIADD